VRGGEHDTAHSGTIAGGLERRDELVEQLVGEGVTSVRLVERDRRDAGVGDLLAKRGVGHERQAYDVRAVAALSRVGSSTVYFATGLR
jgi:hypothetical protein